MGRHVGLSRPGHVTSPYLALPNLPEPAFCLRLPSTPSPRSNGQWSQRINRPTKRAFSVNPPITGYSPVIRGPYTDTKNISGHNVSHVSQVRSLEPPASDETNQVASANQSFLSVPSPFITTSTLCTASSLQWSVPSFDLVSFVSFSGPTDVSTGYRSFDRSEVSRWPLIYGSSRAFVCLIDAFCIIFVWTGEISCFFGRLDEPFARKIVVSSP